MRWRVVDFKNRNGTKRIESNIRMNNGIRIHDPNENGWRSEFHPHRINREHPPSHRRTKSKWRHPEVLFVSSRPIARLDGEISTKRITKLITFTTPPLSDSHTTTAMHDNEYTVNEQKTRPHPIVAKNAQKETPIKKKKLILFHFVCKITQQMAQYVIRSHLRTKKRNYFLR